MMAKESYNIFCEMWAHHNEDGDDIPCCRTVINKLFIHFGDEISSAVPCKRLGLVIFPYHMTEREAVLMIKASMIDFDKADVFLTEAAKIL